MSSVNYKKTWGEESGDLVHVVHGGSQERQATGNLGRRTKQRDPNPRNYQGSQVIVVGDGSLETKDQ